MLNVFKAVYSTTKKLDPGMKHILQTRAWVIQILYIIFRLFLWITGESKFLNEKQSCFDDSNKDAHATECIPLHYDHELVNEMKSLGRIICPLLLIFMSITSIATYRWRSLGSIIIYLECLFQIASNMAFMEGQIYSTTCHYVAFAFMFICLYTGDGA